SKSLMNGFARNGAVSAILWTAILLIATRSLPAAHGQEPPIDPEMPRGISVDQIEQRFAAQEQEFKKAREQYTYREAVSVQTLDLSGRSTGEYAETFDV